MSITVHHHPERDLTIFEVEGQTSLTEQIESLRGFYDHAPTHLAIWDFSQMSGARLSPEELKQIIAFIRSHGGKRAFGRTALVAENDLDFGLSRMSSMLAEAGQVQWQIEAFRSRQDALLWLGLE